MKRIKDIVFVVVGSFCIAYSTVAFLNPNSVITGGGVGLAQLFYAVFPVVTLGSWIAIIAIPLILLGMKYFGKAFVVKTFISIALISLFTDVLKEFVQLEPATDETILASIFGGLLIGLGVGLVMLGRSSTGGTTILAEVIALKSRYKTSQVILVIDAVIMFCSIFVYGDVEKALFSVIGVYVTSRVVDLLLSGKPAQKTVSIITNNAEALGKDIYEKLDKNGTILKGAHINQQASRTLLMLAIDVSRLPSLYTIVKEHDPDAYLVVQEAAELYGSEL